MLTEKLRERKGSGDYSSKQQSILLITLKFNSDGTLKKP